MGRIGEKSVTSLIRAYGDVNPSDVVRQSANILSIEQEKGEKEERETREKWAMGGLFLGETFESLKDFRNAQQGGYEGGFLKFIFDPEGGGDSVAKGKNKIDELETKIANDPDNIDLQREHKIATSLFPEATKNRFDKRDARSEKWAERVGVTSDEWNEMSRKDKRIARRKWRRSNSPLSSDLNKDKDYQNYAVQTPDYVPIDIKNDEEFFDEDINIVEREMEEFDDVDFNQDADPWNIDYTKTNPIYQGPGEYNYSGIGSNNPNANENVDGADSNNNQPNLTNPVYSNPFEIPEGTFGIDDSTKNISGNTLNNEYTPWNQGMDNQWDFTPPDLTGKDVGFEIPDIPGTIEFEDAGFKIPDGTDYSTAIPLGGWGTQEKKNKYGFESEWWNDPTNKEGLNALSDDPTQFTNLFNAEDVSVDSGPSLETKSDGGGEGGGRMEGGDWANVATSIGSLFGENDSGETTAEQDFASQLPNIIKLFSSMDFS